MIKNLSIGVRLAVGFSICLLILASVVIFGIVGMSRMNHPLDPERMWSAGTGELYNRGLNSV